MCPIERESCRHLLYDFKNLINLSELQFTFYLLLALLITKCSSDLSIQLEVGAVYTRHFSYPEGHRSSDSPSLLFYSEK